MCEQLSRSYYMKVECPGLKPVTSHWQVWCPSHYSAMPRVSPEADVGRILCYISTDKEAMKIWCWLLLHVVCWICFHLLCMHVCVCVRVRFHFEVSEQRDVCFVSDAVSEFHLGQMWWSHVVLVDSIVLASTVSFRQWRAFSAGLCTMRLVLVCLPDPG